MYVSYYDTSGSSSTSRLMVTVGLVSDEERWKRLELAWNAALPPDVPFVHMKKLARALWHRYDEAEKLIRTLVDLVKQETEQTFIVGLRADHYRAVNADYQLVEHFGPALGCVAGICVAQGHDWVKTHHAEDKQRHFHEEGDAGLKGEGGWTRCIKSLRQIGAILQTEPPVDESDKVLVPFQCCDMIAWTYRRALDDGLDRIMTRYSWWFKYMHELLPKGRTGALDEKGLRELCEENPRLFPRRERSPA